MSFGRIGQGLSHSLFFEDLREEEYEAERKGNQASQYIAHAGDGHWTDAGNEDGSVKVTFTKSYLGSLSAGTYNVVAKFSTYSGNVNASFTVAAKPSESSSKKSSAKPVDNVVTCQMAGYPANYAWNEAAKACQPGYIDDNGVFHTYANQYLKATRKASPNTRDDHDSWIFALLMMLSLVFASYAGVRLIHEDWEA